MRVPPDRFGTDVRVPADVRAVAPVQLGVRFRRRSEQQRGCANTLLQWMRRQWRHGLVHLLHVRRRGP